MNKTQADAIAQAILERDQRRQNELRSKRATQLAQLARKRRVAWFCLAGCATGAAIAYFGGARFTAGVILGGLAGSVIGSLVTRSAAV